MEMMPLRLETIQVENPCSKVWNQMQGGKRVRFCEHCGHHVHNLSEMNRDDAQLLLNQSNERVCVRYSLARDWKVQTLDYQPRYSPSLFRTTRFWLLISTMIAFVAGVFHMGRLMRSPSTVQGMVGPPAQNETIGSVLLPSD
jgi:hypothetical protein